MRGLLATLACLALACTAKAVVEGDATIGLGGTTCAASPLPGYFQTFQAGLNLAQFPGACGRCIWVKGAAGAPFIVRVARDCPTCTIASLNLSEEAYRAVTGHSEGTRRTVSWDWAASCGEPSSPSLGDGPAASATSSRRLLRRKSAAKAALERGDGQPGYLTDWVTPCEGGRRRCPSLFLASWGFQCANNERDSCCRRGDGKDCTRLERWEGEREPRGWMGRDLEGTSSGEAEAAAAAAGDADEQEGGDGGGTWQAASATVYWSYPDCCHDSSADQTECTDYSGCKWEGMFAGLHGKQPLSWVKSTNIAAFFETPNSRNRKVWGDKWAGKTLRIRNPDSGKTMEVTIYDTCDDSDCDGCCTRNANQHGGQLVDLEYHTAKRFWDGNVPDVARIEWQLA